MLRKLLIATTIIIVVMLGVAEFQKRNRHLPLHRHGRAARDDDAGNPHQARYPLLVSMPLELRVVYERGEDGFILARIREVPAAMSQGRTRKEARENVLDALRELVLSYLEDGDELPPGVTSETLRITATA